MTELNRTLDRALTILNELAKEESIGLRELSRITNVSLAATERIIKTLEVHNYVDRDKAGKFILGRELFYLGKVVEARIGALQIMSQELNLLVAEIDETVYLAKRRDKHTVFIDGVQSQHPIQYVPEMGKLYDLPYGATGKIFLAYMDEKDAREVLAHYDLEYEQLKDELEKVRKDGHVVTHGERFEGLNGFGFPIINSDGTVNFMLTVAIPTFRFSEEKKSFIIERVKKTISRISVLVDRL